MRVEKSWIELGEDRLVVDLSILDEREREALLEELELFRRAMNERRAYLEVRE